MSAVLTLASEETAPSSNIKAVAFASLIGTTVEWFDFFIYGSAAALVFNKLFFVSSEPLVGTLLSLGSFAVGIIARPLGGILFGHFGDRIGRKSMLVVTLLMMGFATGVIGLVPTYATIGVLAPIVLVTMRILQGLAVGGEWGGAVLMAIEHAPEEKRGFYGSIPHIGLAAGIFLSALSFWLLSFQTTDAFLSWGWRVPFLLSFVLVIVGLSVRLKLAETPEFKALELTGSRSRFPLGDALRQQWGAVALVTGAVFVSGAIGYLVLVFSLLYAVSYVHMERGAFLLPLIAGAALECGMIPVFGKWSDEYGRRKVFTFGCLACAAWAFPYFLMLQSGSPSLVFVAVVVMMGIAHAWVYGSQAAFISEVFDPAFRYTAASTGYQLGAMLSGALPPLIAVSLVESTGGKSWPVASLLVGMSLTSFVCGWYLPAVAERSRARIVV
jgi:MFS transporter, MHS family, shikimate and dehydroshikimate transport protein